MAKGNLKRIVETLNGEDIDQLELFLEERRVRDRELTQLQERQKKLADELQEVNRRLRDLYNTARKAGRRMPRAEGMGSPSRTLSLKGMLIDIVRDKKRPCSIRELAEAALQKGYSTKSHNFLNVVTTTLRRNPEFVNVARGEFDLSPTVR